MKRIGILTFHRSINYGAYMQCLSLSHLITQRFPECKVEVIDYESKIMHDIYVPKFNLACIKHPKLYPTTKKKYSAFKSSLKYLPLSDKYFCFDGIDKQFEKYITDNYDVVIVGSDAVWNWVKRGFPNHYLLGLDGDIKKLSYAASAYGMEPKYVGEKEKEYFADSLKNFTFIGYRDDYTKDLVKSVYEDAQPQFTCDPTVFLDCDYVLSLLGHTKDSFKKHIYNKYNIPQDKTVIGVMETSDALVKELKKKYGKSAYIICVYNYLPSADKFISDLNPLEWSQIFSIFDITVTNFFHGTLLSLRNNTPLVCIDRTSFSKTNEGKIHDVLRRMNLLDCYFTGENALGEIAEKTESVLKHKKEYKEKIAQGIDTLGESKENFIKALKEVI